MPLSRFTALPQQPVVQPYVPQDFRFLAAAGQAKQAAYDEGLTLDQTQDGAFGKFAVRNVDVARRDELHNQYVSAAQKLVADKYQGDYGQAMPELRRLATGIAGNEFWNHATNALSRQKDMYETEKAIQKKGGTALAFNRDAYSKPVYNKEDGSYNDIDYDVQERLDWTKPKADLMKDIAKDSRLTGLSESQIAGVLQHGSMKGVDASKVVSVAKQMLTPYMGTPEGMQEMRYYLRQGASPEQAQAAMLRSLAGIGSKQVGHELDQGFLTDPTYLYRLKKADKLAAAQQELVGPEGETGVTVNPLAPTGQMQVDEKGRPYVLKTKEYAGAGGGLGTGAGAGVVTTYKDYGPAAQEQLSKARKDFNDLYPKQAGMSNAAFAKAYNSAVTNSAQAAYSHTEMAPRRSAQASSMVLGQNFKKGDISGLQGKQIQLLSTTGNGGQQITVQQLQEEVGKGRKIASAQVTGELRNSPIPGAYRVTLMTTDEHGQNPKPIELAVGGPKQEQDFKSQFQPIVNSALTGQGAKTAKIGNIYFRSVTAPRPDGSGFDVQVRGYEVLPNGNKVPLRERDKKGNVLLKNGRPVYSPNMDLRQFTDFRDNLFQKTHGDLFGQADYTPKDAEENVDLE